MRRVPRSFALTTFAAAALSAAVPASAAPGDALGPEVLLTSAGATFHTSVAATDGAGNLVAISGTVGQRFTPTGVPVGAPFNLGTGFNAAAIAMQPNGDFAVVGRTGFVPHRLWTACFAADGSPKGSEQEVFTARDILGEFDVAMDDDGDFVVAYDDTVRTALVPSLGYFSPLMLTQNVRAQRYHGNCVATGAPVRVAHRTGFGAIGDIGGTQVGMDAGGGFVVMWQATGTLDPGIKVRSYRADGTARTFARTVNTDLNVFEPVLAVADDGSHAVAWQSYPNAAHSSVMVRLYRPTGVARGPAFQANEPADDARFQAALGMSADGHLVVSWSTNPTPATSNDVYARRFDAQGVPLAGEFLATVDAQLNQGFPQALVSADGDFTLFWQGANSTFPNGGSFVRRYEGP